MKNRLFPLITLTLCTPLYGMLEPLGTDYEALLEQAIVHVGNNQNSQAVKYLQWITMHDQDQKRLAGAYYGLGNINAQNKQYSIAKFHFKCALNQEGNEIVRAQTLYDLGQIYISQNKYRKAMSYFYQASQQNDDLEIKVAAERTLKREQKLKHAARILLHLKQDEYKTSSEEGEPVTKRSKSGDDQDE